MHEIRIHRAMSVHRFGPIRPTTLANRSHHYMNTPAKTPLRSPQRNALAPPVHTSIYMGSTKRTTIRLSDERQLLLEKAKEIVASDLDDDPPNSDVIDAALTHLIESQENIDEARDTHPPHVIQDIANTSVIGLRYRTSVESKWR